MQPSAQRSVPMCGSLPCKISGATNCAVPTNEFLRRAARARWAAAVLSSSSCSCSPPLVVVVAAVSAVGVSAAGASIIRAVPKSVNLMCIFSSSKIFSGLRSLHNLITNQKNVQTQANIEKVEGHKMQRCNHRWMIFFECMNSSASTISAA